MSVEQLLIAVVVIAISGVSNWLQKRRQRELEQPLSRESEPAIPPPENRQATSEAPAKPLFDLETELRRLLGGEPPVIEQPPRRAIEQSQSVPPPVPVLVARESEYIYTETEEPAAREMGRLPQAARAYQRAESLQENIGARLTAVDPQAPRPPQAASATYAQAPSSNLLIALKQIRNPQAARQAMIASIVIGLPKSLEREPA